MSGYNPAAAGHVFAEDAWGAATFCGPNGGNCVEVNLGVRGVVGVRDSKSAAGPLLAFGGAGWGAFLDATKARG
jgi:hypothetical protein